MIPCIKSRNCKVVYIDRKQTSGCLGTWDGEQREWARTEGGHEITLKVMDVFTNLMLVMVLEVLPFDVYIQTYTIVYFIYVCCISIILMQWKKGKEEEKKEGRERVRGREEGRKVGYLN